jgi:hypothetical protein
METQQSSKLAKWRCQGWIRQDLQNENSDDMCEQKYQFTFAGPGSTSHSEIWVNFEQHGFSWRSGARFRKGSLHRDCLSTAQTMKSFNLPGFAAF